MGGEDVHRLCARDPRHPFHRQRIQPERRVAVDPFAAPGGVKSADQQRAFFRALQCCGVRPGDGHDDARTFEDFRAIADGRAGRLELGVAHGGTVPGAALDRDIGTERNQLFHGFGNRRTACLARRGFLQYRELHVPMIRSTIIAIINTVIAPNLNSLVNFA